MSNTVSYRLSTVVAAAICGMVILTALALGGVFSYSYIKSLKGEFYDRVHAEGDEYSLEVYSFLHQALSRLEELGRDNSIRVTMMMGVDYPLIEKMAGYDNVTHGVDFYVQRMGENKIFSSSSRAYDENTVRTALRNAPYSCSLCPDGEGRISTVYAIPIRSRSEVVGSAACVVNLAHTRFAEALENSTGCRMLISADGKNYDLLSGEELLLDRGESLGQEMSEVMLNGVKKGVLFRSPLVPGLAYFVSDERLENSLYRTFWLLLPMFAAVICISVLVSLFISSKLTGPLRRIMDSAENISKGDDDDLMQKSSRLYEINALQNSLSTMLESLRRTKGLERYQFFFENVGDLVCITDIDGVFLEVNSAVYACLGYEREQFLQKTFYELVPAYERQNLRGVLNSMFAVGSPDNFECSMLTRVGKTIHCEVRSRKVEYRGKDALLSVVRDVTDRKKDEEELQRYASELLKTKQVEERNSAHMAETLKKLEDAMARAEVANRAKSEFLAQMSHEIRTPMNSILGMADMLSETTLTGEQQSYVTIFRDSGKALLSLINDILDLSKIESGKLTLENTVFDIDRLVDEVAGIMSVSAWKKGLAFACHVTPGTAPLFEGDPTRIKQVLLNLLSNAIKFTDSGTVSLEVSSSPLKQGMCSICFVVRDTGIGIDEDKVELIFENFVQADSSTTRKYGGTGLGLSITRNLVELMEGSISVRNLSSGGAEFRAEIIVQRVNETGSDDAAVRAVVQGRNILVVEDSPLVRNFICDSLNDWGANCSHSGSSSLVCVQSEEATRNAELVIVSDKLGEEDGLSAVESIRERLNMGDLSLCTLSTSPGDSSNCPAINRIFGVKGSIRWPITRGGLRRAMLDIYRPAVFKIAKEDFCHDLLPLRILVAEDSESNRMLVDFYLKDTPFRMTYAGNGVEALEYYKMHKYDMVLMDMQMPEKDGYEAVRELREYESEMGYPAAPVIALTANTHAEDRKRCLDVGCTDYLGKPLKKITLVKAILKHSS
ncbi:response regulator [Maridesulfovibrio sp. FT414]|uniref:hybrid sensor histidine kinase/response regulator n=1 Tax=Maridesulfovibrio sp. FT414 TaxID=2979469 RepID=UPI003D804B21